jgi:hypothetical protein
MTDMADYTIITILLRIQNKEICESGVHGANCLLNLLFCNL